MPLAFESLSHGVVAFGFFNIDSDMLLLEQEFFFAEDFCDAIVRLTGSGEEDPVVEWDGFRIEHRAEVGDLMGAIHKVRFTGFIGETYRLFPFPESPEDFKQKPEGVANREVFARLIRSFGVARRVRLACDGARDEITLAGHRFARREFHRLIDYVWLGGYPRWRDGVRPDYVQRMAGAVTGCDRWFFSGISLSE